MAEPLGDVAGKAAAVEAKKLWRSHTARTDRGEPALRIGLAASFTADPLVPFVGAALLANDTEAAFTLAPYNQLFQTCLDPRASLGADCDVIALLWRLEDLMLDEISGFLRGDREALSRASGKLGCARRRDPATARQLFGDGRGRGAALPDRASPRASWRSTMPVGSAAFTAPWPPSSSTRSAGSRGST